MGHLCCIVSCETNNSTLKKVDKDDPMTDFVFRYVTVAFVAGLFLWT